MGRPLPAELVSEDLDNVVLGMPGAWAENVRECSDHYTTKIGGQPDFPLPLQEVNIELLKCGICNGYLGLVAQVYAPLNLQELRFEERTIYIFGCPTSMCGLNPLSWRTIRFQRQMSEELLQEHAHGSGSTSSDSNAPLVPFDEELQQLVEGETSRQRYYESFEERRASEWWDDSPWEIGPSEHFYITEEENMSVGEIQPSNTDANQQSSSQEERVLQPNSQTEELRNSTSGNANEDTSSSSTGLSFNDFPVLPCFYIYSHNESRAFRNRRAQSSTMEEPGEMSDDLPQFDAFEDDDGPVADDDSWEDDDYENTRAMLADRTYMKFKKRLDCYPEQCLRSCFRGRALWASEQHEEPGPCPLCGGPRVYEMQLMPPLLYFLQQACREGPPTSYGPIDWEWLTLLVFTCSQSCSQVASNSEADANKEKWTIVEEAIVIQYEI